MKSLFKKSSTRQVSQVRTGEVFVQHYSLTQLHQKPFAVTDDVCEVILSHLFDFILPTDIFYFVKHPAVKKDVLKVRTVCKQWDQILKKILPIKKHLKIEKSCCNNEPGKGKILEGSILLTHSHFLVSVLHHSHITPHALLYCFVFPLLLS
jgi:hypothetical protein